MDGFLQMTVSFFSEMKIDVLNTQVSLKFIPSGSIN